MKLILTTLNLVFLFSTLFSQTFVWEKRIENTPNTPEYHSHTTYNGKNIIAREDGKFWSLLHSYSVYDHNSAPFDDLLITNNNGTTESQIFISGLVEITDMTLSTENGLYFSGKIDFYAKKNINDYNVGTYLFKADSIGNILWDYNFGYENYILNSYIAKKGQSIVTIIDYENISDSLFEINSFTGEIISSQEINTTGFVDFKIDTLINNFFILKNNSNSNINVIQLDYSYNQIAEYTYGGSGSDLPINLCVTNDGGYIFSANTTSQDGDITENFGEQDIWLAKCNSEGIIEWQKSYGTQNDDDITHLVSLSNEGYAFSKNGGEIYNIDSVGEFIFKITTNDNINLINGTTNNNIVYCGENNGAVFAEINNFGYNILESTTTIECGNYGSIYGEAYGYFPPFSYEWSTGDTIANQTNLDVGVYYLTITDSLNNTIIDTFIVDFVDFEGVSTIISNDTLTNQRKIYLTSNSPNLDDSIFVYTIDSSFYGTFDVNTTVLIDTITDNSIANKYYVSSGNICGQSAITSSKSALTLTADIDENGIVELSINSVSEYSNPYVEGSYVLTKKFNENTVWLSNYSKELTTIYDTLVEGNNEYFFYTTYNSQNIYSNIVNINFTSTEIIKKAEITIYPNPTNGILNLGDFANKQGTILKIHNVSGSLVYQSKIRNYKSEIQINLRHLPKGIYFVDIGGTVKKKVILK